MEKKFISALGSIERSLFIFFCLYDVVKLSVLYLRAQFKTPFLYLEAAPNGKKMLQGVKKWQLLY